MNGTVAGTRVHNTLGSRGYGGSDHDPIGVDIRVDDVDTRQYVQMAHVKFRVHRMVHGRFLDEIVTAARDVT